jgi:alcohol dehydrogenase class IV
MPFRIGPKSEVLFGEHAADEVGEKTKSLGCSKVLCVFDQGVKDAGIAGSAMESLEKAGLKVVPYGGVLADPPDYMVNECGELARVERVDGIVGVGGGSTLDTAKAVNVLLGNPGPIQNYYFAPGLPDHKPGKPLVLVPTTAGTASEITSVAVITNTASNTKGGVKGAATSASCAIVDPLLTLRLPPAITAATGMDTFAHALEAYTSGISNIMSDVLAEKSIGLVARYLPRVVRNGSDLEARTNMCFACLIAGMAFSDAAPHFGHAFGHTLGSTHHVPHGTGCAIAQPGVIEIVAEAMPEKVRRIGELMGLEVRDSLSPSGLGTVVSDGIIAFNREVGLPTLKQLNIKESDLPSLAEGMMRDVCFIFLPVKLDQQEVLKVIRKAYAL